jgi:hypothetical protein
LIIWDDTSIEAAEKREWGVLGQQKTAANVILQAQVE